MAQVTFALDKLILVVFVFCLSRFQSSYLLCDLNSSMIQEIHWFSICWAFSYSNNGSDSF